MTSDIKLTDFFNYFVKNLTFQDIKLDQNKKHCKKHRKLGQDTVNIIKINYGRKHNEALRKQNLINLDEYDSSQNNRFSKKMGFKDKKPESLSSNSETTQYNTQYPSTSSEKKENETPIIQTTFQPSAPPMIPDTPVASTAPITIQEEPKKSETPSAPPIEETPKTEIPKPLSKVSETPKAETPKKSKEEKDQRKKKHGSIYGHHGYDYRDYGHLKHRRNRYKHHELEEKIRENRQLYPESNTFTFETPETTETTETPEEDVSSSSEEILDTSDTFTYKDTDSSSKSPSKAYGYGKFSIESESDSDWNSDSNSDSDSDRNSESFDYNSYKPYKYDSYGSIKSNRSIYDRSIYDRTIYDSSDSSSSDDSDYDEFLSSEKITYSSTESLSDDDNEYSENSLSPDDFEFSTSKISYYNKEKPCESIDYTYSTYKSPRYGDRKSYYTSEKIDYNKHSKIIDDFLMGGLDDEEEEQEEKKRVLFDFPIETNNYNASYEDSYKNSKIKSKDTRDKKFEKSKLKTTYKDYSKEQKHYGGIESGMQFGGVIDDFPLEDNSSDDEENPKSRVLFDFPIMENNIESYNEKKTNKISGKIPSVDSKKHTAEKKSYDKKNNDSSSTKYKGFGNSRSNYDSTSSNYNSTSSSYNKFKPKNTIPQYTDSITTEESIDNIIFSTIDNYKKDKTRLIHNW